MIAPSLLGPVWIQRFRSVSPYKWPFPFRFKTERRSFSQQRRSPNGTVPFLPNRPLVFTLGPFSPCVGLFTAHLKANTTASSSLFFKQLPALHLTSPFPHPFPLLGPLATLSSFISLSWRPGDLSSAVYSLSFLRSDIFSYHHCT